MVKENPAILKSSTLKIKEKKSAISSIKEIKDLIIKFKAPAPNVQIEVNAADFSMLARYTLSSINDATSYKDSYEIGMKTLLKIASEDTENDEGYVAKIAIEAANATKDWMNGYNVVVLAISHIANKKSDNPVEVCSLVNTMMASITDFSTAYRVGLASLNKIKQLNSDEPNVKSFITLVVSQAESTSEWESAYKIVYNGLIQVRSHF